MYDGKVRDTLVRDLCVFEDESNPSSSKKDLIWASTILDQVFDHLTPDHRSLRQILEDLRREVMEGSLGSITFPVTSVNGQQGDVDIRAEDLGLGNVDNTRDADKPLSIPQKNAMLQILQDYDFNVDLSALEEHLMNTDNPHAVKVADLNKNGELEKYIGGLIAQHNYSTLDNIHMDIRRSLSNLWLVTDQRDKKYTRSIEDLLLELHNHLTDPASHPELFDKKEDISNKILSLMDPEQVDHVHYPSARAVADYLEEQHRAFRKTIPDIQEWISDLVVVESRKNLPEPTSKYYRKGYLIRQGPRSFSELAVCRYDKDSDSYLWDIHEMGGYSKFDPAHFIDSADGLRLNTTSVVEEILNQKGVLEQTLDRVLDRYYTKEQIDGFHYIGDLKIVPGTMDGTLRYYINDDLRTMSSDVRVTGLQRLAFLEYVTEREIWDNAIHSQHIMNKAVITRHLEDKAVTPKKIACRPGYILANLDDESGEAHEISIKEFIKKLGLSTGGSSGSGCECEEMIEITAEDVEAIFGEELPIDPNPPAPGPNPGGSCDCEEMVEITEEDVENMFNSIIPPSTDPTPGTPGSDCSCEELVEISEEDVEQIYTSIEPVPGSPGIGSTCACEPMSEIGVEEAGELYNKIDPETK